MSLRGGAVRGIPDLARVGVEWGVECGVWGVGCGVWAPAPPTMSHFRLSDAISDNRMWDMPCRTWDMAAGRALRSGLSVW